MPLRALSPFTVPKGTLPLFVQRERVVRDKGQGAYHALALKFSPGWNLTSDWRDKAKKNDDISLSLPTPDERNNC